MNGVLPILSVPFDEHDAIDFDSVETQIDALADGGCNGVILFGFGSEFYKLTDDELRELLSTAVEAGQKAELPVYASITRQATVTAEAAAAEYAAIGADGLMILPPHQANPSEEAILEHLRRVGNRTDLPLMVQYAPQNVGVSISPDTFARLSDAVPTISYYKIESHPPGPYISRLLDATSGNVDVLVGSAGQHLIDALDRGAVGVIPSGGMHEVYVDILDRYRRGDRAGAIEAHTSLLPLLNTFAGPESFIHFDKWVQAERGFIDPDSAGVRAPTSEPDERAATLFREHYQELSETYGW